MDEKTERDKLIELGFQWQDFFTSNAGKIFIDRIQIKIGQIVTEQNTKRVKIDDNTWDYDCNTIGQFERHRGGFIMLQWVISDLIEGTINSAKRYEKERQDEEKSKTTT